MGGFKRVLIANRGEIAIRIARAAAERGLQTVAVFAEDDAASLHVKAANQAIALKGAGAKAYLDVDGIIAAAKAGECDALHPGYGFLSENPELARACAKAKIAFIGPSPEVLEAFGDKGRARQIAAEAGVPVLSGAASPASLDDVKTFFASLPPGAAMIIKAVSGGGGRGMRVVRGADEVERAYAACEREATGAFGDGRLYAERLIEKARHLEVQIAGDGKTTLVLGERDCSLQRRHQKILEIAPAPNLDEAMRQALHAAARKLGEAVGYRTLGTIEFLLDVATGDFAFIEANARLQVEHTVTEEVTDLDLVAIQIALAEGRTLTDLGLAATPAPRGFSIQARVNTETLLPNGDLLPGGGRLSAYEPPSGRGVRVDGYGYAGYATNPNYDSMLAKVIVKGPSLAEAAARTERALSEFRIEGVQTNIGLLRALLADEAVLAGQGTTRLIESRIAEFLAAAEALPSRAAGAGEGAAEAQAFEHVEGTVEVEAPLQSTVGVIEVAEGDLVRAGQPVAILEAMKMEHLVKAPASGRVVRIAAAKGDILMLGQPFLFIAPQEVEGEDDADDAHLDLDEIRPDLAEALERLRLTRDEGRPEAVAKRRRTNHRTARENIEDLIDPGTFIEYGAFGIAAQRARHPVETLIKMSPADGLICGFGSVNGALFPPEKAACVALAYDYTVLAGTQGQVNHRKTDRILELALDRRLPVVFFAEGGGGRPGDTEPAPPNKSFSRYAKLSGEVPKIAVVTRYCFAGNASLAGMSDIIIAAKDTNIGMAGPAMIEGGGMGMVAPTEIGPLPEQALNGVVDIVVEDEAEGTRLAKQAMGYFQGNLSTWSNADQRLLRRAIPENRLRAYDPRPLLETLADTGTVMELRRDFAPTVITAFIRIEGRPIGVLLNDNRYLGGAIDCDGSDKASRFMQLCDCFDIPIVSLIDTPGFMVGLESERQAAVRKTSRMFIAGAKVGVPLLAIVLRKFYGLGGIAMTGGSMGDPMFTAAWPTGEFGGMGLEGAVKLGFPKELEAETDPVAKKALFDKLLARMYALGKAVEQATRFNIDAVIDPADTRRWIVQALNASPRRTDGGSRRWVDAW